MFEENPAEKKPKKQMSEERKEALREQLRKAREKKKANKLAREAKAPAKKPVTKDPESVTMEIIQEEPVAKPTRRHPPSTSKPQQDESAELIASLKAEILELKKGKTSEADMAEIRELKLEMKEIRDATRAYKEHQKKVKEQAKKLAEKPKPKAKTEKQLEKPQASLPINIPKPVRHSTFKKSIWTNFK